MIRATLSDHELNVFFINPRTRLGLLLEPGSNLFIFVNKFGLKFFFLFIHDSPQSSDNSA